MSENAGDAAERLFDLLADDARNLVRDMVEKGSNIADVAVVMADTSDPSATGFMRSIGHDRWGKGPPDEGYPVACAVVGREVIDHLAEHNPELLPGLEIPVNKGDVLTVVMTEGVAAVFHLFMSPSVETNEDKPNHEKLAAADALFEAWKEKLADIALENIAKGKVIDEIMALLFDLSTPKACDIMRKLIPDLDLDRMVPPGADVVSCGVVDIDVIETLNESLPGLKNIVRQPKTPGAILALVIIGGDIIAYDMFVIEKHPPSSTSTLLN